MEFYIKRELLQIQRWTQSKSQRNTRKKFQSKRKRINNVYNDVSCYDPKQKTIQTKFIGKMILGDWWLPQPQKYVSFFLYKIHKGDKFHTTKG